MDFVAEIGEVCSDMIENPAQNPDISDEVLQTVKDGLMELRKKLRVEGSSENKSSKDIDQANTEKASLQNSVSEQSPNIAGQYSDTPSKFHLVSAPLGNLNPSMKIAFVDEGTSFRFSTERARSCSAL